MIRLAIPKIKLRYTWGWKISKNKRSTGLFERIHGSPVKWEVRQAHNPFRLESYGTFESRINSHSSYGIEYSNLTYRLLSVQSNVTGSLILRLVSIRPVNKFACFNKRSFTATVEFPCFFKDNMVSHFTAQVGCDRKKQTNGARITHYELEVLRLFSLQVPY